jgi:hypothetical protein
VNSVSPRATVQYRHSDQVTPPAPLGSFVGDAALGRRLHILDALVEGAALGLERPRAPGAAAPRALGLGHVQLDPVLVRVDLAVEHARRLREYLALLAGDLGDRSVGREAAAHVQLKRRPLAFELVPCRYGRSIVRFNEAKMDLINELLGSLKSMLGQPWGFPTLSVLVGAVWTLYKYLDVRGRESKRPFLEKQMELYFEACQVAARLVKHEQSPQQTNDVTERFWQLYWGELSLVESHEVKEIMVALGRVLDVRAEACDAQVRRELVQDLAYQLAHACRASIAAGWGFRARPRLFALADVLHGWLGDAPDEVFRRSAFEARLDLLTPKHEPARAHGRTRHRARRKRHPDATNAP